MPASRQDSGWVRNAGNRFAGGFTEAIRDAVQDLGLTHGRIGYDDLRVGAKVAGSLADVFDAFDLLMFVRERKSAQEVKWLREATRVNQVAIERTVQSWSRGKLWKELVDTYHAEITALGGWVCDPGGVFFANPLDGDPAVRLRVDSEDFVVQPGTNIMFDCHGTKNQYCWDGGKTWVVEDYGSDTARRIGRATAEAMNEIHDAMRPGAPDRRPARKESTNVSTVGSAATRLRAHLLPWRGAKSCRCSGIGGGRRRSQLDVGRGHGDSCSPPVSGR